MKCNKLLIAAMLIFLSIYDINIAASENSKYLAKKSLTAFATKEAPKVLIAYPQAPKSALAYVGWEKYFRELLILALSKVTTPFDLKEVPMQTHSQTRAERLLEKNVVSIHWLHTNRQREKTMTPIRIPLLKGLIGWRIFLVHQSKFEQFKNVTTLDKLKNLNLLQGIDWPDTEILKENGFRIQTSRNTNNLLRMLQYGRGDYFPRSVAEIWSEIRDNPNMGLAVEEKLVIRYPTAYYFFVARDNNKVKNLVEQGLNLAIADGSYDKLFMKYFGEMIERSNLRNRKVLSITNPQLPEETPLKRDELWFSISTKTK